MDTNDSIMNYINEEGAIKKFVPSAPLQPRDMQLVMGNDLIYINEEDHPAIKQCLDLYDPNYLNIELIGDFPESGHILAAANITVVGRDAYIEYMLDKKSNLNEIKGKEFRINNVRMEGHNDACFHTIKPGAILSLYDVQQYAKTFPNWDIGYLHDVNWEAVEDFLDFKHKVKGKWWVPGQEDNDLFTHFVETWLKDWVGYIEETVFDVNVLVLDEYHVCVSQMDNPIVNKFLKKHKMEPVHIPWKHRFFWDGGLHCITLDLYREGSQQDYFPARTEPVIDEGV
jgi:hypothetical protein